MIIGHICQCFIVWCDIFNYGLRNKPIINFQALLDIECNTLFARKPFTKNESKRRHNTTLSNATDISGQLDCREIELLKRAVLQQQSTRIYCLLNMPSL